MKEHVEFVYSMLARSSGYNAAVAFREKYPEIADQSLSSLGLNADGFTLWVRKHGFPTRSVEIVPKGGKVQFQHDHIFLAEAASAWFLCDQERELERVIERFDTLEEAIDSIAQTEWLAFEGYLDKELTVK